MNITLKWVHCKSAVNSQTRLPRLFLDQEDSEQKLPKEAPNHSDTFYMQSLRKFQTHHKPPPPQEDVVNHELKSHLDFQVRLFALAEPKPVFDFAIACFERVFCLFLLLSIFWVFPLVALAIKLDSPGPVFFYQLRIGRFGIPFWIAKFRTLYVDTANHPSPFLIDKNGMRVKVGKDPRTTRIGLFLRRWSIDELPQIFNILKGDMNLIGPRPLVTEEVSTLHKDLYLRLCVKPGISGLAQVLARDVVSAIPKAKIDCLYITKRSFSLYFKIFFLTLKVVLNGK